MTALSEVLRYMKPPYIFGASTRGTLHLKEGLPCQDAFLYDLIDNRIGVIAVADGLGSAVHSDLGALIAVKSAILKAKDSVNSTRLDDLPELPIHMLNAAREGIQEAATLAGLNVSDLATTLIVVLFGPDFVFTAQIGDGAAVGLIGGELRMLSGPSESEYTNEVIPITDRDWEQHIRYSQIREVAQALAVFTDGCQRASLIKRDGNYEPFGRFFHPVFSFALSIDDTKRAEEELSLFLNSPKMTKFSEDDKTMVLAIVGD